MTFYLFVSNLFRFGEYTLKLGIHHVLFTLVICYKAMFKGLSC